MRTKSLKIVVVFLALCAALLWACADRAISSSYNECKVPPQISVAFIPNILLVQDYSGSMQFGAYAGASGGWANDWDDFRAHVYDFYQTYNGAYNHSNYYYGYFKSDPDRAVKADTYYKYNATGGYFYVWGSAPEGGLAGEIGTFATGISGNVLNWLITSRIDASLKALIGGKAVGLDSSGNDCDCVDTANGNCYLSAQGSRRIIRESSMSSGASLGVSAQFHVRPTNWKDGNYYNWNDSGHMYPTLEIVLDSVGLYRGYLTVKDEQDPTSKRRYERWAFTLTETTTVELTLNDSWSNHDGAVAILASDKSTVLAYATGDPVTLTPTSLAAGTYYVLVTPNCVSNCGSDLGSYYLESNVNLTADTTDTGKNAGTLVNKTVGAIRNARVRVEIAKDERKGAINDVWDRANWGFMFYNTGYGDGIDQRGRLVVRCGGAATVEEFAKYVEGRIAAPWRPYPYNATPTGPALTEAENYFQQEGGINSDMFGKTTDKDPFYSTVNSELKVVTCRKSYVLLVSDGVWNNGSDPIGPAYQMHRNDLRADVPGEQYADVFSIFAFGTGSDLTYGTNALKWVAMYGGFTDLTASTACRLGYPYPLSSTTLPSGQNSGDTTFANYIGNCGSATANSCCKEWTSGTGARLGWPDNYFQCTSGDELVAAIQEILGAIQQKTASSSAVATVAQQTGDGDMVIRAMFEAVPPDDDTANKGKLLWYGHMEAYWPDKDGLYDFEIPARKLNLMCKDNIKAFGTSVTTGANCWDAAAPGSFYSGPWPTPIADTNPFSTISASRHASSAFTLSAGRRIFTVSPTDTTVPRTQKKFETLTESDLGLSSTTVPTSATVLKDWVLGKDVTDGTLRTRKDKDGTPWILGDIVYSTPVVVGPPALGAVPQDAKVLVNSAEVNAVYKTASATTANFNKFYLDWRQITQLKYRDKVVYVGGNDGMLHAFIMAKWYPENDPKGTYITRHAASIDVSNSDKSKWTHPDVGKELWAYIPSNMLTELKTQAQTGYALQTGATCIHRFMIDLAPRAFEVVFQDQVVSTLTRATDDNLANWPWRTVIMGGERGGGDMYFALDVTDPYNPKVLWEYSVLKNMVAHFDFEAALPAFMTACFNNTSLTPGSIGTCQAPQLPTAWWNSHCDSCACVTSACTTKTTDKTACRSMLKQMGLEDATWVPFNNPALYDAAKKLPVSWSRPYLGRVGLPSDLKLNPCDPHETNVPGPNTGSACYPKCTGGTGDPASFAGVRNFAFVGGGIRLFETSIDYFPSTWPDFYKDGFRNSLSGTFLLALDIETGLNAFRYIWPEVYKASKAAGYQKEQKRDCDADGNCSYQIPYAMSDPVVLDVWDRASNSIGGDGYDDYVYVGDMNGVLYGIKMNFDPLNATTAGVSGIYLDLWKTKPIPLNTTGTKDYATNWFRSRLQPLTIQPSISPERETISSEQHLRIIIAGGKHEDIEGDKTDSTDVAKMSLYNVRDKIQMPTLANFQDCAANDPEKDCSNVITGSITYTVPALTFAVRSNCEQPGSGTAWDKETSTDERYRCKGEGTESLCQYGVNIENANDQIIGSGTWSGCRWMFPDTSNSTGAGDNSDCCEPGCGTTSAPATTCWKCVYDLIDPGEKVINKPLIAGGVVFITTFSPFASSDDVCKAGGVSYIYAFDYMCQRFPEGFRPLRDITSYTIKANATGTQIYGQRGALGLGVASQPVLDSTGNYLIIQNSLGEIKRQNVNLLSNVAAMRGWKEK